MFSFNAPAWARCVLCTADVPVVPVLWQEVQVVLPPAQTGTGL
jgi:hypothetical protein